MKRRLPRLGLNRPCTLLAGLLLLGGIGAGCAPAVRALSPRQHRIETALRPLLTLDPDANWTAAFNRLLPLGPDVLDVLSRQPAMQHDAPPGDLRLLVHTSLMRMLVGGPDAPRLSASCFETTLDLLHFDIKVSGHPLGDIHQVSPRPPAAWHELYPAGFDHALAARIDVETDRRAMLRWWRDHRDSADSVIMRSPLRPRAAHLWPLLARHCADAWGYDPRSSAVLCSAPPLEAALFREHTHDYNLVRAACIWLATSSAPGIERALIDRVASDSPVVAYNARFALRHSPDPRIREVIRRFDDQPRVPPPRRIREVHAGYNRAIGRALAWLVHPPFAEGTGW